MSGQTTDQTITNGHAGMLHGRIDKALDDQLPALLAAIERSRDIRDKTSLASVALDISSRAHSDAMTLLDAGRIDNGTANGLFDQAHAAAHDAAGECGMDLEDLEQHSGY